MRKVILIRLVNSDSGSEGVLCYEGNFSLTLELPWRNNAAGISCIPPGSYRVKWWKSPTKGWCYRLQDVPNRDYILIHSASFAGDKAKGLRSDLLGCISLGRTRATYQGQRGIFNSRSAVRFFNETMNKQTFILEVKNDKSYHISV